jgi:UTP--glucose-1-phosphate uridylyltransferase
MKPLKKAIFPVAGFGTRLLPATKSIPKEMVTIVDRPLIDYAVQEAVEAGCDTLIFITSRHKKSIEDYFDRAPELEYELEQKGKLLALQQIRSIIPENVRCIFIRQEQALGLGHAIGCAASLIEKDEPCAVILPDDLIDGVGQGCLAQMNAQFELNPSNILAIERIPPEHTSRYGIIDPYEVPKELSKTLYQIKDLVEKPHQKDAPSDWAIVGRYILRPEIIHHLAQEQRTDILQEIQLTTALKILLNESPCYGLPFHGHRFDCGHRNGLVHANIHFGLKLEIPLEKISYATESYIA